MYAQAYSFKQENYWQNKFEERLNKMTNLTDEYTFPRGLTVKNRVVIPPMTTKMSYFDGVVTNDEIEYYHMHSGDVGLFITGAANVQPDGKGWEGELGVYDDKFIPGLTKLASAIKTNGTKAILQIFHGGRMTNSSVLRGTQPVSASAVAAERAHAEVPRALESEEVVSLIHQFTLATKRAVAAGFDGIELHGANTYIIQQFFSPHSNRREDEWGGSLEKRYHFINTLVDEVIKTVDESGAKNFIVGYRFSPEEYENPGIRMSDTMYLLDQLVGKKLDYLHLSLADVTRVSKDSAYSDKPIIEYVNEKIAGRLPLIGVGNVRDGQDAKKVLTQADFVAVGCGVLIDPEWTSKVLAGHDELLRRELSIYDKELLHISNGVWSFLQEKMPDCLIEK
jgi:2,4-dienoyl-CoA reductase-like NADH-dependent reductase (Old Yellow Enzyme family)